MIKINNLDKYFNRHKNNEIHVINNTTLELPDTGLIALLGPSGSGKTTLLNVIGGLDSANKGNIYIDDIHFKGRNIDKIRALNIGYIFQDYKLLDNMTVYENIALVLKIIGLKNKEDIKKRVEYVLEQLKLSKYKNRLVTMLSGGERQRVGIARALVKCPKVIIADEPTGNLDNKNTLEIMNIIKSISKNCLVILVTHEEEIAKFYSDEIILLKDGKIIDKYKNNPKKNLSYDIESNIYLKDFNNIESIKKDNYNINIYSDKKEKLNLNIIYKNGVIYLKEDNENKIHLIDNSSDINLINDHKKDITYNDLEINYKINNIDNPKYSSIITFKNFIINGFKLIKSYSIVKKFLLLGFFLTGIFSFYSISSIFSTTDIKDKDFIDIDKDYLKVSFNNINEKNYNTIENDALINYVIPSDSKIDISIYFTDYYQTKNDYTTTTVSLCDINNLNIQEIYLGNYPSNSREVVIDKLILERLIKFNDTSLAGLNDVNDFLNKNITIPYLGNLTIVGITNRDGVSLYTNKDMFIDIISNNYIKEDIDIVNYDLVKNDINLLNAIDNLDKYEVLVKSDIYDESIIGKNIEYNNTKLKVVGLYKSDDINIFLVNKDTLKNILINNTKTLVINTSNKEDIINKYKDKYNIKDSYIYDKKSYIEENKEYNTNLLIVSSIILSISLIEVYLMIRSTFLNRIKEVGIYRALSVKKSDIYKMFAGEIIAISLVSSFVGISFMALILKKLCVISYLENLFLVNIYTYLFSLILIISFNLLIGLIPVYFTLRKNPAEIFSSKNIN